MNETTLIGWGGDPTVFYGPSTHFEASPADDQETEDYHPLSGPNGPGQPGAGGRSLSSVSTVLKSPVGLLIILLPIAYIAFRQTFGG